ncbi:hypothetical protein Hamer_G013041 [Homarus americanus]|uniref:Uncharacterized protein n=1 Tax=Homarus americanus TaxID=6706 RepID=A0A8J5JZX7_HOMAM|nr:hypothetical protein Hamer_G013041 [Homarus americanus]
MTDNTSPAVKDDCEVKKSSMNNTITGKGRQVFLRFDDTYNVAPQEFSLLVEATNATTTPPLLLNFRYNRLDQESRLYSYNVTNANGSTLAVVELGPQDWQMMKVSGSFLVIEGIVGGNDTAKTKVPLPIQRQEKSYTYNVAVTRGRGNIDLLFSCPSDTHLQLGLSIKEHGQENNNNRNLNFTLDTSAKWYQLKLTREGDGRVVLWDTTNAEINNTQLTASKGAAIQRQDQVTFHFQSDKIAYWSLGCDKRLHKLLSSSSSSEPWDLTILILLIGGASGVSLVLSTAIIYTWHRHKVSASHRREKRHESENEAPSWSGWGGLSNVSIRERGIQERLPMVSCGDGVNTSREVLAEVHHLPAGEHLAGGGGGAGSPSKQRTPSRDRDSYRKRKDSGASGCMYVASAPGNKGGILPSGQDATTTSRSGSTPGHNDVSKAKDSYLDVSGCDKVSGRPKCSGKTQNIQTSSLTPPDKYQQTINTSEQKVQNTVAAQRQMCDTLKNREPTDHEDDRPMKIKENYTERKRKGGMEKQEKNSDANTTNKKPIKGHKDRRPKGPDQGVAGVSSSDLDSSSNNKDNKQVFKYSHGTANDAHKKLMLGMKEKLASSTQMEKKKSHSNSHGLSRGSPRGTTNPDNGRPVADGNTNKQQLKTSTKKKTQSSKMVKQTPTSGKGISGYTTVLPIPHTQHDGFQRHETHSSTLPGHCGRKINCKLMDDNEPSLLGSRSSSFSRLPWSPLADSSTPAASNVARSNMSFPQSPRSPASHHHHPHHDRTRLQPSTTFPNTPQPTTTNTTIRHHYQPPTSDRSCCGSWETRGPVTELCG